MRRIVPALLVAALGLALTAPGASAATASYTLAETFSAGTNPVFPFGACGVNDLDVDAEENVYVHCGGVKKNGAGGAVIKKFDKFGNPVDFTGTTPYISGNVLLYAPNPERKDPTYGQTFSGDEESISVDRSSGPTAGFIYVSGEYQTLDIFAPSGKWLGSIRAPGLGFMEASSPDSSGNLYFQQGTEVRVFDAGLRYKEEFVANQNELGISGSIAGWAIAIGPDGEVWGSAGGLATTPRMIRKIEANAFTPASFDSVFSIGGKPVGKSSPYVNGPLKVFATTTAVAGYNLAIDQDDGTLFVRHQNGIRQYSPGAVSEFAHNLGPQIGTSAEMNALNNDGLALGDTSKILYTSGIGNIVLKYTPGAPLPVARSTAASLEDLGHTSVTVRGTVDREGGGPITTCIVRYGATEAYNLTAPCSPNPASSPPGSNFTDEETEVSATISGLAVNATINYAFVVNSATGQGFGVNRTAQSKAVLKLRTSPAEDITDDSATLVGELDPDGLSTTYRFTYGLAGDLNQETAPVDPISDSGVQELSIPIEGLKAGARYSYRLIATNSLGTTQGEIRTFRTAGPPVISGVQAKNVTATSADLTARINPGGYPTTYHFKYGPSVTYGSTLPAPPAVGDAGDADASGTVTVTPTDLDPSTTYHFRIVATNQWGTSESPDTTFNFQPQACPNERVRQITKASFLPDCRAYELVSPANAGGVQIYPGNELITAQDLFSPTNALALRRWSQNTGLAQGPSRFTYVGGLGAAGNLDAPNILLDTYLATRTERGWESVYPGIKGAEDGRTGRMMCSASLDRCIDYRWQAGATLDNVPHLFGANGEKIGTLPTNVKAIPGGANLIGDGKLSLDGKHYVFSSLNAQFAPGGITTSPGSAYVNDLEDGSVSLISTMPNGNPITVGSAGEFITFPPNGTSSDGSHILMQTNASGAVSRLYIRVGNAITYEIGAGVNVTRIGITRDGSSVLFATNQALNPDQDSDTSTDIYRWDENNGAPTLTVVTQAAGKGNSNACSGGNCNVSLLSTARGETSGYGLNAPGATPYNKVTLPGLDSRMAAENGAVFFFSPEILDAGAPQNGKNLYLARNGAIKYVATIGSSQSIERIQISPDGLKAGLVTKAQLTDYDNAGFRQMYTYDAQTGEILCASCNPSGEPPTADVEASQNGPFMADDGRVFFTTSDRLVAGDVDTFGLPDVYEFVDGRPQLISSGVSTNAKAPGGASYFVTAILGLESVSANGVDVFFSTTDTLVPQDLNGPFAKIYTARTNGGFAPEIVPAPCVAADECHGEGAERPAALQIGTGSAITGGNHPAAVRKKKRKAQKQAKAKRSCAKAKRKRGAAKRFAACAAKKKRRSR